MKVALFNAISQNNYDSAKELLGNGTDPSLSFDGLVGILVLGGNIIADAKGCFET